EVEDEGSEKVALLNIEIEQIAGTITAADVRMRLHEISTHTGEIAADVHNLSHELHPSKLQTLGLVAAVQALCRDISHQCGVQVVFTHGILPQNVDANVSLCLYRIAQEALHNVTRHSRAREAQVQLTQDGDVVALHIADWGVGFDPNDVRHGGLGLISMRERVAFLRGQLVIHAFPGGGTRVGVRVPVAPPVRESSPAIPTSA